MQDLIQFSIVEAVQKMANKEFSPVELVEAYLKKAEENKNINAFITLTPEKALKQAKISGDKIMNNAAGIIEGIPIGIKDLFCTKNILTTAGSRILSNFIPFYESTATSMLYEHGGICLGKTNMDEFAMGSANTNSAYGHVINPWNNDLVPGGSSGGSAAAVAAKLCLGALGSDTGGSIRQPASFCGIVGIKPTYGRVSRFGMVAFASSLDQAGVLTRNVKDAALLLQAICGYDTQDSTSANISVPNFTSQLNANIKGMKVGIPHEYIVEGMSEEIINMWQQGQKWLTEQGAIIKYINLPHTQFALNAYYIIAPAEASSNLSKYDGMRYGIRSKGEATIKQLIAKTRAEGFGCEVKRRIMMGTYVLSAEAYGEYYLKAQKIRRLIANDFQQAFKEVDAILTPSTPGEAFKINQEITNPVIMYLNDIFTVPANLAGLPAISVPAAMSLQKLPLGLQLIGNLYDESTILNLASMIEKNANFKNL